MFSSNLMTYHSLLSITFLHIINLPRNTVVVSPNNNKYFIAASSNIACGFQCWTYTRSSKYLYENPPKVWQWYRQIHTSQQQILHGLETDRIQKNDEFIMRGNHKSTVTYHDVFKNIVKTRNQTRLDDTTTFVWSIKMTYTMESWPQSE